MWLVSSAVIFQSIILQCDFRVFFSPSHHRLSNKDFTLTRALQEKDIRTRDVVLSYPFDTIASSHFTCAIIDTTLALLLSSHKDFPHKSDMGIFMCIVSLLLANCYMYAPEILRREHLWWTTHFLHPNLNETDAEKERESCLCRGQSL